MARFYWVVLRFLTNFAVFKIEHYSTKYICPFGV